MTRYTVHFCPSCGKPVETRLLYGRERKTCPSCGWIHFEDPKVAAGVLVEQDGQVLLVKRLNRPRQGFWSFPAGFVDAGEDPARAAERECLEETGLRARVTRLLEVVAGREHKDGADIVIVYTASIVGGSLQAGDDAGEAAFFPRSALPPLAFRTTEVVLNPPNPPSRGARRTTNPLPNGARRTTNPLPEGQDDTITPFPSGQIDNPLRKGG